MCNHRPKACPERGGGNERQRIDGGVASGLLIFPSTPQSPCGDSSPSGEPFSTVQAHCTVPYPSRSDRFTGVTGGAGGLRGEIEIFPGPLQKSITSSLLFPAPSASLQGRWQRGCRGCRGRSPRPRRWRAPVRRLPACRRLRISPYRVCPFR